MSAREFYEWQAYFTIYPFSEDREDLRAALIAHTIANTSAAMLAQRAGKRSYRTVPADQFLPDYLKTEPDTSADPMQRDLYASFKSNLANAQAQAQGITDAT